MKKTLLVLFCTFTLSDRAPALALSGDTTESKPTPATAGAVDYIHDDYNDSAGSSLHSRGLLSYGTHTNTFHLRTFYGRYNLQFQDVQFFFTLRGQKDTHDPPVNYQYILNNISLYDYGVHFRFLKHLFISPRGAATYRENFHSYLLLMPYFHATNAAEFDAATQFIPVLETGPGIRVGYENDWLVVGYSQGDFRHVIPSGFMAKAYGSDWYARATLLSEYADPNVFRPDQKKYRFQLSLNKTVKIHDEWTVGAIAEVTYHQDGVWWLRLEESVERWGFTLGLRQMKRTNTDLLAEVSLTRRFANLASLGAYYGTNGHLYFGTEVNF